MITGAALWKLIPILISLLPQVFKFLGALHERGVRAEAKQEGYAAAIAEGLLLVTKDLEKVHAVEIEASAAHAEHPEDDSGFLGEFERKGDKP